MGDRVRTDPVPVLQKGEVTMGIIAGYAVPHPPMILPEIGRGEEKTIQPTIDAYRAVAAEIAALDPETIVVTTPHSVMYSDYFHISPGRGAYGDMSQFGAGSVQVNVAYDEEMVSLLCELAERSGLRAGTLGERDKHIDHGTMIPLRFIEQAYREAGKKPDYRVIRIGLSGLPLLDHYALGILVQKAADDLGRRTVMAASGDLSHYLKETGPYGFHEEGPVYDERIMDTFRRGAFNELLRYPAALLEGAGECGHRSFTIMAGAMDCTAVETCVFSHQDVTGVGYGVCSVHPTGYDASRNFGEQYVEEHDRYLAEKKAAEDPYVQLARMAVEKYVKEKKQLDEVPDSFPDELFDRKAGVFVSLHLDGNLRGCIGTIAPVQDCIAEEIVSNGISACSRDPRFDAVTEDELPYLEYSVDVMGEPEPVESKDQLDVKRYGVIVTSGARRGLLLPNLDGVKTVDQQIDIARKKAGIGPKEKIRLERFEAVRHY